MAMIDKDTGTDWTACELVERILPDPIVRGFDRGETFDNIQEAWPSLSVDQIKPLIAFAHSQRSQLVS